MRQYVDLDTYTAAMNKVYTEIALLKTESERKPRKAKSDDYLNAIEDVLDVMETRKTLDYLARYDDKSFLREEQLFRTLESDVKSLRKKRDEK